MRFRIDEMTEHGPEALAEFRDLNHAIDYYKALRAIDLDVGIIDQETGAFIFPDKDDNVSSM